MSAALHYFSQCKRLLTRITLHLLRIRVVFFQLFKLFRVALQNGQYRLKFRQLIPMLLDKASSFLRFIQAFLNFIYAVSERVIGQQIQTRQDAVKRCNALFRLFELNATLLIVVFMKAYRTLKLTATGVELADFRFWIGLERDSDVATDKTTERLV
ncbi:hypothetical protein D3C80_1032860 [compost metagenome]